MRRTWSALSVISFAFRAVLRPAKLKLSVADEIIAKIEKSETGSNGATFAGLGKYSNSAISDAMLDVINTHAGVEGMAVKELREILMNEGLSNTQNLGITLHITGDRLTEKRTLLIFRRPKAENDFSRLSNWMSHQS